jgi:hypothetical protein
MVVDGQQTEKKNMDQGVGSDGALPGYINTTGRSQDGYNLFGGLSAELTKKIVGDSLSVKGYVHYPS